MTNTYCGKNCESCTHKQALNCPGCQGVKDCDIAKCCASKGHSQCTGCNFSPSCNTLRGKEYAPQYRQKRMEAEKIRVDAIAKRTPILGKWLWILFWLFIPSSIASILSNETLSLLAPGMQIVGKILNIACMAVYAGIMIYLGNEEDRYRTAGKFMMANIGVSIVAALIPATIEYVGWLLLVAAAASVLSLIAECNEYNANATILTGVNNALSDKWTTLWKWQLGTTCALIGSIILIFISILLGIIVAFLALIGLCVVRILKLVYLYQTAKAFRTR